MAKKNPNKNPKKGVPGKGTGKSTKSAISVAKRKGFTTKQIATAGMRSPNTISQIVRGDIKNPPANLDDKIRKGLRGKKPRGKK